MEGKLEKVLIVKHSPTDAENIDPATLVGLIPDFSVLLPSERSLEEIGNEDDDPLKSFDPHGSPWRNPNINPNAQIRNSEHTGIDPAYRNPVNVGPRHQHPTHYQASAPMVARNWNPLARTNARIPSYQQFPSNGRSLLNLKPIKHSSTSAMDTRSTNNPTSMGNSPVDHQGFKSEKDRLNEQLKSFLVTITLQNVPVIQWTNSAEQSVGAMPEPVTEAPRLTVKINLATDPKKQHLQSKQAQTAPVTSQPLTLAVSQTYGRSTSMAPRRSRRTPGVTPNRRSQGSQRSTPKGQYDIQEELLNEFRGTAEESLSQHSESSHLRLFDDDNDAFGDTAHAEIYCDSDELDPAQRLAAYLTDTESVDSSFKVTFVSRINGTVLPFKFPDKDKARSWQHIVEEELCRSAEINNMFGAERFLLRHEDGGIVDLENDLGDQPLTIYVEEATEVDIWWVERGMIRH